MVLNLILSAGTGIIDILSGLFRKEKLHTYNAGFGNGWEHLSGFNHGFCVTGSKSLTKEASFTNCFVSGPTGSGKSSTSILGSAFSLSKGNSSIIYFDVSGELFEKSSGYLSQKRYKILRMDFSNPEYSESFNPLARCKSISDIQKIAHLIILNSMGEAKTDPFWNRSSEMIISLFARYLIFHSDKQYRNLYNVLRLVEEFIINPGAIDLLFVKANDEDLLKNYKAALVMGERTLQSVIASVRAALNLWADETVIRTTSTDTLDFELLRKEKICIYVTTPLKDLHYFKPLSALFFQCFFNEVMSAIPQKSDRAVFAIIDEAATMRFSNLSVIISNIRKYRAGVMLCMQDENALISLYGQNEAHQIKTNMGCQIFLKGQPLHTCHELSQILGKYTYTDDKGIDRSRELMTADELRMCDDAIVLIGNYAPLKCKMVPYFNNFLIHGYTQISPCSIAKKQSILPPRIQFDSK